MLNFINLKFKMNIFYIFDRRLLENVPEYENISYRMACTLYTYYYNGLNVCCMYTVCI